VKRVILRAWILVKFKAPIGLREQIGAITKGFFDRPLAAPEADFLVVPALLDRDFYLYLYHYHAAGLIP
jgi:hypothetical protein